MPRPKPLKPGRRISVWLPPASDKIAKQIDNVSGFVQMSLEQAASIMAFDIIKKHQGIKSQPEPTQEQYDRFNRDHPVDPLTAKRTGKTDKWHNTPNSPQKPELW